MTYFNHYNKNQFGRSTRYGTRARRARSKRRTHITESGVRFIGAVGSNLPGTMILTIFFDYCYLCTMPFLAMRDGRNSIFRFKNGRVGDSPSKKARWARSRCIQSIFDFVLRCVSVGSLLRSLPFSATLELFPEPLVFHCTTLRSFLLGDLCGSVLHRRGNFGLARLPL